MYFGGAPKGPLKFINGHVFTAEGTPLDAYCDSKDNHRKPYSLTEEQKKKNLEHNKRLSECFEECKRVEKFTEWVKIALEDYDKRDYSEESMIKKGLEMLKKSQNFYNF